MSKWTVVGGAGIVMVNMAVTDVAFVIGIGISSAVGLFIVEAEEQYEEVVG